jgi:hypothetical protein
MENGVVDSPRSGFARFFTPFFKKSRESSPARGSGLFYKSNLRNLVGESQNITPRKRQDDGFHLLWLWDHRNSQEIVNSLFDKEQETTFEVQMCFTMIFSGSKIQE